VVLKKLVIYMQKIETRPLFLTCKKVNFKCIKDVNIWPETLTILQEKTEKTLDDIGLGNYVWIGHQLTKKQEQKLTLHSKRNCSQKQESTYKVENIFTS
jgi:hypothetical protein